MSNERLLTRNIKCTRRRSSVIADSALVRAVVEGLQLELQLRRLLQVGHGHANDLAVAIPADVGQTRWVGPQDRAPQRHHLGVSRTHVLENGVQYW